MNCCEPARKACAAIRQAVRIRPTSRGAFAARSCLRIFSEVSSRHGESVPRVDCLGHGEG